MNGAGEESTRRNDDTSSARRGARGNSLTNGSRVVERGVAARAVVCDVEVAVRKRRRNDARENLGNEIPSLRIRWIRRPNARSRTTCECAERRREHCAGTECLKKISTCGHGTLP